MINNQKIWQYIIKFYEDLVKGEHDLVPMLDLVKWFSTSKYKDEIYPVTSHASLNISAVEGFHNQMNFPSIGVQYYDKSFKINYVTNQDQTHNLEKFKCHPTQVVSLLEGLLIRLADETKLKQQPVSRCSGESKRTSKR
jgi:hypothetical protein